MPHCPLESERERPVRVVLDTNCSLALFLWEDPRCAGLRARIDAGLELPILDPACLEEWHRVLRSGVATRSETMREHAIARYARRLTLVPACPSHDLPRCRDPDDQKFLTLAASAGAAVLYTRDRELLRLRGVARSRLGFCIAKPEASLC